MKPFSWKFSHQTHYTVCMEREKIFVYDRETHKPFEEKIMSEWAVRLLYERNPKAFSLLRKSICTNALFSKLVGFMQKRKRSARKVKRFIEDYNVDSSAFIKHDFNSFNDFFIRKLKKEARPIAADSVVMPADGRYLAYDNFAEAKEIAVKGTKLSLHELVGRDDKLAEKYMHGPFVIARLAPCDYHRFHFPVSGKAEKPLDISGALHSVNPLSIRFSTKCLTENKRSLITVKTPDMGDVLVIPVGAVCVGSIHYTYDHGQKVDKGDEMGYFSFGGSTLILLFEPGRIKISDDILSKTKEGIETLAKMGTPLGSY